MANWYVRPSSAGSNNGTNWSNAWSASSVSWGSVSAGDTVWIAGGSYSSLNATKSGTSGNPLSIKRATASDAAATGATGWSSAFDATATFSGGINLNSVSNVTLDGNAAYGILCNVANGASGVEIGINGCSNVSLLNLDVNGPGFHSTTSETHAVLGSHGGDPAVSNLLISKCRFQNMDTMVKADNWQNCVIEKTLFKNCSSGDMANVHPDTIYWYPCTNVTVRYCRFENVDSESNFFDFGGSGGIVYHNNVMVQGTGQSSSAIELKQGFGNFGVFTLANNTFVGWTKGVLFQSNPASGSTIKNNLFVSAPNNTGNATSDYNGYSNTTAVGAHATTNSTDPFVNASGGDYHLKSGSWAIGAGTNLGSTYSSDYDGVARSASGVWDLGAYAFAAATTTAPSAPKNLRITATG